MPTYEYLCKSCATRFEVWQHMTDDPLTECPTCHGTIRRVLYPAGIVFKGSGFYKTDHPASHSGTSPEHSEPAKAGTTAKSGAETTTKSGATTKEPKPTKSEATKASAA